LLYGETTASDTTMIPHNWKQIVNTVTGTQLTLANYGGCARWRILDSCLAYQTNACFTCCWRHLGVILVPLHFLFLYFVTPTKLATRTAFVYVVYQR